MTPSIDVNKNISNHLNTTVGYLLGENEDNQLLKKPEDFTTLTGYSKTF